MFDQKKNILLVYAWQKEVDCVLCKLCVNIL